MSIEMCPSCGSADFLKTKMIAIGEIREESKRTELEGAPPPEQLYADRVKPEHLRGKPLERFVDGLFCTHCEKGFIPDAFLL